MRNVLITALLVTILGLVATITAQAHHSGPQLNDALTRQYINYAYQYFRQPVGCAHGVIGEPPGPHEPGVAWAEQPGCSMWFTDDVVATQASDRIDKWAYCGVIMHEVGHTLGLSHVTGTVKSPMNVEQEFIHPGCWGPKHVLHRHKHRHRKHIHGKVRVRMHFHKHYHIKIGQP